MKSQKYKKETKKRGKLDKLFPASYYEVMADGIERKHLDKVVSEQWEYMQEKLSSSIWEVLKKRVDTDIKIAAMSSAFLTCVKQLDKNPSKWPTMDTFFSYWLVSSWREFRNQGLKEQKHQQKHDSIDVSTNDTKSDDSFQIIKELEADEEGREEGWNDILGSEEFVTFVSDRVYEYLDDCYMDGLFTMREITIFKIYYVNNYSFDRMVKETQFSRTRIISALSKIKKHLASVDFRWYQFHPNLTKD